MLVAHIVDDNDVILSEHTLREKIIITPEDICQLGLTQTEQLNYIGEIEKFFLQEQIHSINKCPYESCPKCNSKIHCNGSGASLYHGFYNEHKLHLGKWVCSSATCAWSYNPSIKSHFGSNVNPELKRSQAELGASLPYRKGAVSLKLLAGNERNIHNHMRVRAATQELSDSVEKYIKNEDAKNKNVGIIRKPAEESFAEELIATADGAYIHDADKKGHNFEAMVAKIYRPEDVVRKDKHHSVITQKQCIGSAMKDEQKTMKEKMVTAAKCAGMTNKTRVVGLADGAKNCWNVIKSLSPYCIALLCILDWFHIGKRFKNVENQLPKSESRLLKIAKISLWHGHVEASLDWLQMIKSRLSNKKHLEKLQWLVTYLEKNKEYIVNYNYRHSNGLPYTSSIAESTVEHYANARLKKSQKMQWKRDGAHKILQIRGAIISNVWDRFCRNTLADFPHKKAA